MINRVTLLGHLGRDVEVRYTANGKAVANASLATNYTWRDEFGDKQEEVEWHRITCWGKAAETFADFGEKGRMVYIEGALKTRTWEKDGVERRSTEVVVRFFRFLDKGRAKGTPPEVQRSSGTPDESPDDDIPF